MLWILPLAAARDVDLKVHDMHGVVTGEVTVELGAPGKTPVRFVVRDDGSPPDAVAGDRMYTARAEGLEADHGSVVVRAGERTWQGGFRFETAEDPVLLVGLEQNGFAAASTREVMFVPRDGGAPGGMPGGAPGAGGVPGGAPGGATPGGGAPGASEATARAAPRRVTLPDGMWASWGIAALVAAGLGAVAWASARRAPRLPPLRGPAATTSAARGPYVPGAATDLFVGPAPTREALAVGEGRWRPEEIALAALRVRGPVRVVVTAPADVEAEGDGYRALAEALAGVADLLWVEAPGGGR